MICGKPVMPVCSCVHWQPAYHRLWEQQHVRESPSPETFTILREILTVWFDESHASTIISDSCPRALSFPLIRLYTTVLVDCTNTKCIRLTFRALLSVKDKSACEWWCQEKITRVKTPDDETCEDCIPVESRGNCLGTIQQHVPYGTNERYWNQGCQRQIITSSVQYLDTYSHQWHTECTIFGVIWWEYHLFCHACLWLLDHEHSRGGSTRDIHVYRKIPKRSYPEKEMVDSGPIRIETFK